MKRRTLPILYSSAVLLLAWLVLSVIYTAVLKRNDPFWVQLLSAAACGGAFLALEDPRFAQRFKKTRRYLGVAFLALCALFILCAAAALG